MLDEYRNLLAFLTGVLILASIWGGILFLGRRRRTPGRMKAEPVESNLPRVQRGRVAEIDAEYGRDYRGPGRPGEAFFAPGGVAFLVMLVVTTLLSIWLSDLFRPLGEWAAAAVRRLSN